ncbi:hypothetical protein M0811_12117 [Anaeramoeba ignava]|uniref:BTB domain-containing protein n=1 Tax=Anaeramoeba ignava TaxID=1746090 RepID=A0A9Q0LCV9_ANAIG|nr:hypothetical protein M0811_12117 [Anaeramoeba ignava]
MNETIYSLKSLYDLSKSQLEQLLVKEFFAYQELINQISKNQPDFKLFCGKNKIQIDCHEFVLRLRAPFLFLQDDINENKQFDFTEFEVETVDLIVKFIYTGTIEFEKESFEKIWKLANQIGLKTLKIKMEKEIQEIIDKSNAIKYYLLTKNIGSIFLYRFCESIIIENLEELFNQNAFSKLNQEEIIQIISMIESRIKGRNKIQIILKIIEDWGKTIDEKQENSELSQVNIDSDNSQQNNSENIFSRKILFDTIHQIQEMKQVSKTQFETIQDHSFLPLGIIRKFNGNENEENARRANNFN